MIAELITAREWQEIKRTAHAVDNRKPYFKSATIGHKTHYYELKPSASTQVAKKKRARFAPLEKDKEAKASASVIKPQKPADVAFIPKVLTGEVKPTIPTEPQQIPPLSKKVVLSALKIGDKLRHTVTMKQLTIRTENDKRLIKFPQNWELISTLQIPIPCSA